MEREFKSVGIERSDEGKRVRGYPLSLLVIAARPHPANVAKKNTKTAHRESFYHLSKSERQKKYN